MENQSSEHREINHVNRNNKILLVDIIALYRL